MEEQVKLVIAGVEKIYDKYTTYEQVAADFQDSMDAQIALVSENGAVRELYKRVVNDAHISFITVKESMGHKTYERSTIMLFIKAIYDYFGREDLKKIKVEFSLGAGVFCRCEGNFTLTNESVEKIQEIMQDLINKETKIMKKTYKINDAIGTFSKQGMQDKVDLFKYRRSSEVNVYELDGYKDYYYGYMLSNTKYIKYFRLDLYEGGILLSIPRRKNPGIVFPMDDRSQLFKTLDTATKWNTKMGIDNVGDLNNQICEGKLNELILVQEAIMESRIGEIAHDIAQREGVKFIMIAGPSSSGKTTFSHRLSIQIRTHGLNPHPIAVDDYFVERNNTPKDEDGNFNFECLDAIDIAQFNKDMVDLLNGKEVELPTFNFKTGKREYKGNFKKLGKDDVLVIEGIHALNDQMSFSLPKDSKYKIYISALTTLNIDDHNRIPTTDARILRRIVRDARTRGVGAKKTIHMWQSVRRGEESNIFPFQETADVMFNSALIYELAVLKQFAEPLLFGITKEDEEYYEAKRLLKFLDYFLGVSSESIPNNSIIREFVGGSCFNV